MDEKLLEIFHKNKELAFATSVDNKPHARILQIMKIDAANNSIYFDLHTNPLTFIHYDF